jgi:hypothetical protein
MHGLGRKQQALCYATVLALVTMPFPVFFNQGDGWLKELRKRSRLFELMPLHSISFTVHYTLINLSFGAT